MFPELPPDEMEALFEVLKVTPGPVTATSIWSPVVLGTLGIWRVSGSDWSAILKVVRHSVDGSPNWHTGKDVGHWYFWLREVFAYSSGLIENLTGPLRGAHCHLINQRSDDGVALWLEDLGPHRTTGWGLNGYRRLARHVGRTQGAFLVDRPLPTEPWLSQGWMRGYLGPRRSHLELLEDDRAWSLPVVAAAFPTRPGRLLRRLADDQEQFLSVLERLPQTVVHRDLHPDNIFLFEDETALVDWAFVGIGAIGEDPGNLIPETVLNFHMPPEQIGALHQAVLGGYLAGLRRAGWHGDPDLVRLGFAATAAVRYSWIIAAMLQAALENVVMLNSRPLEDTVRVWAGLSGYFLEQGEEARRLADKLGY